MKIVLLGGKSQTTLFMYNALKYKFPIYKVIIENRVSSIKIIKGRIKKLGIFRVINQLLFQLTISKLIYLSSKKRIIALKKHYTLFADPIELSKLQNISSVNDLECIIALKEINPDIVLVNGTRIISSKVLDSIPALFINTHVGITPQYRGVHGAYWALIANDKKNCGVTIHQVDKGIDTGDIIKQSAITISDNDNYITYPFHQYGIAIELMKSTLEDLKKNNLRTFKKENVESKLYYHPTFTGYLYNRLFRGIK
jgi:folate-dependent phosphoribosylglycinamide formyltransferase PurN